MRRPTPPVVAIGAVAIVALLAYLAFAVFEVQTLVIDERVDEANPFSLEGTDFEVDAQGTFVDGSHPTSGIALVLAADGGRYLRFEQFTTDNGPDLAVWLRDRTTGDRIDLGRLQGNIGDQNYEVPADVDLDRFDLVDIWCVRFGVSFGTAELIG